MSTIISLFQQAQLAEAAYANFLDDAGHLITTDAQLKQALTTSGSTFSTAQATAFTNEWSVVNHIPDTQNGFSATVFERLDANQQPTGEYSLAIRGSTQIFDDFVADAGIIVSAGIANAQVVDMYNYWQRLNTPAGAIYQAAVLVAIPTGEIDQYSASQRIYDANTETFMTIKFVDSNILADTTLRTGSGTFAVCPATLNVDGHSLGGHLAMAFTRLFPSVGTEATAVNGLGFKLDNSDVNDLFSMLGGAASFTGTQIQNVYGIDGPEFASMNNFNLQQPGGYDGIYIEDGSLLSAQIGGHSISQMTDSLALYNLFAKLDPTLNTASGGLQTITNILKASSNVAEDTLEAVISDLGKLFNVSGVAGFNANEFDTNRDLLYVALNGITAALPANSNFTVRDLSAFSAAQIISNAQDNIAYRYALTQLNPFAILGADYSAHNSNGELDLYDSATRQGQLTGLYLKDRAAMLSWKILYDNGAKDSDGAADDFFRTGDKSYGAKWDSNRISGNWDFIDQGTSINGAPLLLAIDGAGVTQYDHQIVFGSINVDTLLGSGDTDHLYGMGGDDTLTGGDGKDYLEGGQGTDTYIWNSGDGLDTLLDSDGQGSIITNGRTLYGGKQQGANNTYTGVDSAGTLHNYIILSGDINSASGGTLLIDGTIEILNYRQNQLGITLNGATAPTNPNPTNTITGDISPTDFNPGTAGIQAARDAQGNLIGTAAPYEDILVGTAAADHILAGELADNVGGRSGNDWIEGGNGNDYVNGDEGDDLLEGGSGTDILAGDAGDDRIYAGTQVETATAIDYGNIETASGLRGDWLSGGAGADTLIAGADNDVLAGGGGDDTLIAGAGDDHILGDSDYTAQYILEANPRYSEGGIDWYHTSTAPFNWTITPENGTTTFAPVTGEAPNLTANGACPDICRRAGSEAANDFEWRMQA